MLYIVSLFIPLSTLDETTGDTNRRDTNTSDTSDSEILVNFCFSNFYDEFLKVSFSICHSFQSKGQSGQMKGLKRCLQALEQCSRFQKNGYVARVITSALERNEMKLHQPHLGKIEPLLGIFEPRLRKLKLLLGITKWCLTFADCRLTLHHNY